MKKHVYFFRFCYTEIRTGGIEMGCKKGIPHRKWTKDEKLKIVKLYLDDHVPVKEIESTYHVSRGSVCHWAKQYVEEGESALVPRNGNPYAALHTSKSLTEIERLRLLVAKQEVEIARLKKGYWVKGVGANKEFVFGKEQSMKFSRN